MTIIKKISMTGFKSFGDRTVSIKLAPGFTCIVGPNGAGKSNVIDALCFCLGRLSKKTMRADSLKDLIFAGTQKEKPATNARVEIHFDNTEGIFPGGGDTFVIGREVKKAGGSKYMINGKTATRQALLNSLAQANIDPDGSNQFVLQGKIVELTHMNSVDRRKFIETLIGLEKYDQMRDATLKKLDKAERDLGKFEAIFSEVSSQLKKVEKEKNDALKWKELDERINLYNAQLIALKIAKLQGEEDQIERDMENTQEVIEEFNGKILRQEDLLRQESLIMDNLQLSLSEKEGEREKISENITKIKTELTSNETTMELEKQSIEKLLTKKETLENQQIALEEGQTFDILIEEANNGVSEIESQIEKARKAFDASQTQQKEIEAKINQYEQVKGNYKGEISTVKQNVSSLKAEVGLLKKNIKQNKTKIKKLETELKNLKGEEESIEKAIEATGVEQKKIRDKITEIKAQMEKENKIQKDLENKISEINIQKNKTGMVISDFNSGLSALSAEIKMFQTQITSLNKKKKETDEKFKKLSGGKEIEDRIKDLLKTKEIILSKVTELKKHLQQEENSLKKNDQELELLDMKKGSLDSEITDYSTRISILKNELKTLERDKKNYDRDIKNLNLESKTLSDGLNKFNDSIKTLSTKKNNIDGRIAEMNKEKETILDRIEGSDKAYDRNKDDINGFLTTLQMLTQNINISVESIKGAIQESNDSAISSSSENFKKYVYDVVDIMKTIEEISKEDIPPDDVKWGLDSVVQTLGLFTDNADSSIEQIIESVRESTDIAVQESTSNFDDFVRDLMEILEFVPIALQELTLSKSQDLYKELEEITGSIASQSFELNNIEKELTVLNSKKDLNEEKLSEDKRKLEENSKRLQETMEKIEKFNNELSEKKKLISSKSVEKNQLGQDMQNVKDSKKQFWVKQKELQGQIDETIVDLEENQGQLQDLKGIQNLLENISEIEEEIKSIELIIEEKKKDINTTNESIEARKKEETEFQNKIDEFNVEKEKFWEKTAQLQGQIEEETQILESVTDKLRGLQNVQRLIESIQELENEIKESNNKVEENGTQIEEFTKNQEVIQLKVDEEQSKIDELKIEKDKEFNNQKAVQKEINNLNKDVQSKQKLLNELVKNKEREQEINSIGEEIVNSTQLIEQIEEEIETIKISLEEGSDKKIEKQSEIDGVVREKDDSWKKQKGMQDVISSLKADLSMENSKLNNLESKKLITMDQIETLYERGKDYGALPPITEDLSEEGLQSDILETQNAKKRLEPVNLKAIEQYETVKERFDEIDMRRQTIQRERKAILDSIDKIELEKTRNFMKAYHEINRQFSSIFQKLSPGGSAKMILERPDKPFEGGVAIEARPRGKKISSLEILSGGEKTLVALSFIFAVQEFYPAPFFVLDEIDAALDGPNCARVGKTIREFADQAQFIVISHREENIINADRIYGVSMSNGITDVFSVNLQEVEKQFLEGD